MSAHNLYQVCCVCGAIKMEDGSWVKWYHYDPDDKEPSHGYCDKCLDDLMAEIDAESNNE